MQNKEKNNTTDARRIDLFISEVRKRFITYKEAAELYSIGLTLIQEHTKICGATYKLGNKVLVNTDIFEAYLEQFRIPGEYESMVKKIVPSLVGLYCEKS
ncbi:hypothetical protein SAMN02745136_03324 [Anaerocolumna jejuensis DSM 15929]|uniref:Uncharacterized protein n=1 Tax=Anaerocolumna jejuensis DSM 15929 TaxID=1121322 RepID=A0A1M6V8M3_9FIRM|nr:DUF6462 family protein [Anaerocolumna jejuensis]SHK77840.1 hypothetical protein SAMN02745136_03324 [Anaerocolumna jejuensis DSM 15929]